MKLCLITNYINKGYIEETLILNQLINTLEFTPLRMLLNLKMKIKYIL